MQLIFDSDTDVDLGKINMAVINSENINEKFSSDRLIDKFSQNECAEQNQDVKELNNDNIQDKDNVTEINSELDNKLSNSIEINDAEEKENDHEEDSNNITGQLDNEELQMISKDLKAETASQVKKNVETQKDIDMSTESNSEKTVSDVCSTNNSSKKDPVTNNSSKKDPVTQSDDKNISKDDSVDCPRNEDNLIKLEDSNASSEKMDVSDDDAIKTDMSQNMETISHKCVSGIDNTTSANNLPQDKEILIEYKNSLEEKSGDNSLQPSEAAISSPKKTDNDQEHDIVNVMNNKDFILDNTEIKQDNSELALNTNDESIMTESQKNSHIDANTIEINDDSSQDDISQKESSENKSIVLSTINENKQEDHSPKNSATRSNSLSENDDSESILKKEKDSAIDEHSTETNKLKETTHTVQRKSSTEKKEEIKLTKKTKLSNTLDILSDDEDSHVSKENNPPETTKQCINVEDDDDDILLIDDEENSNGDKKMKVNNLKQIPEKDVKEILENNLAHAEVKLDTENKNIAIVEKDINESIKTEESTTEAKTDKVKDEAELSSSPKSKPLVPTNFLSMCKKNVSEMTRNDLEEFCILKIVESVVDRGNIGEMKSQLKKLSSSLDEHRNKIKSITKQNQDLQVALRSVQEACRKNALVTPLKITRSVGIHVVMADKSKQKTAIQQNNTPSPAKPMRSTSLQNKSKQITTPPQNIPVPRLVPAKNSPSNMQSQSPNNKTAMNAPTPIKPAVPRPEKRAFPRSQTGSDTVDLTDDEPPNKVITRPGNQTVRVVSPQNLMPPQRIQMVNSPRKVYIPIGGQVNNIRPAPQAYMVKSVNNPNVRQRVPGLRRVHPAPLPECSKQYQPPSWKSIPPAPEIKLSKVENGIVISWKLDNYREDVHENIASYQIYAYQETQSPPNTNLWKKIGDVKALPLPMACTLTQFVPGFKYYFAVRAVDVRSRQGSFSNPDNIMLMNK